MNKFEDYSKSNIAEKLVKQRYLIKELLTQLKKEQEMRYQTEK
jgi:hypothetical protein